MCFLTSYLYQCGHEEEEQYETCQLFIDAGFCCDEYEQQNVVMPEKCVGCKLATMRAGMDHQSHDAEKAGGEEGDEGSLQRE